MKKAGYLKYIGVFVVIIIILVVIFAGPFYRGVIKPNKDVLPSFISSWIEKHDQPVQSEIIYKPDQAIKIIEGWGLAEISESLSLFSNWNQEEFESLAGRPKIDYRDYPELQKPKSLVENFEFLKDKPVYYGLEGFLFPDTYRFFTDSTPDNLIIKMLENFDRKLTKEMREEIIRQNKTIYEIVTMASIIEKEAPINYNDLENRDARLVSGIFWNRLKIGQALQSDATLSYFFNDNKPTHSGDELKVDSPYNSYKYTGLPPTPICSPSLKAIEAAIYPIETDYFYFLTSLDGKNIYYAKTYQEHLQNKYKYLK